MFSDMSLTQALQLFAPLIIIELILAIFCLYRLSKDKVKYLPKWAWALIIVVFFELIGPIVYLLIGRERD